MVTPILNWALRVGIPRVWAVLVTIMLVVVGGSALAFVLGKSLAGVLASLPAYEAGLSQQFELFQNYLLHWDIDLKSFLSVQALTSGGLNDIAKSLAGLVGSFVGNLLLQVLLVAFILLEAPDLRDRMIQAQSQGNSMVADIGHVAADFQKYIAISAWLNILIAVVELGLLLAVGVDAAILWAAIAFLLSFVPVVGFIISLIPPSLLALVQFGWERAVIVALGFVLINAIVENIVKPRVMKQGLAISPLMVVISLLFWNWVLGPTGAIMAIPLTMALKRVFLERYQSTRILAAIIDTRSPTAASASATLKELNPQPDRPAQ
jgi:predicted PurR-regulated permease PerM